MSLEKHFKGMHWFVRCRDLGCYVKNKGEN